MSRFPQEREAAPDPVLCSEKAEQRTGVSGARLLAVRPDISVVHMSKSVPPSREAPAKTEQKLQCCLYIQSLSGDARKILKDIARPGRSQNVLQKVRGKRGEDEFTANYANCREG